MWIGWFYVWICTFKTINQLPKVLIWNFYSSVFIQNTICIMGQVHYASWQCTCSHSTCSKYQWPVSNNCYTGLSQVPMNFLCSQTSSSLWKALRSEHIVTLSTVSWRCLKACWKILWTILPCMAKMKFVYKVKAWGLWR